jgi:hypothetical protein
VNSIEWYYHMLVYGRLTNERGRQRLAESQNNNDKECPDGTSQQPETEIPAREA